ncbi:MAG: undecaprenyl/decaprenyl-phosphate alpha-N-acetylglucosaminyl 1-phosphate transferase [Actinobacteria bacterium]|nr:MAG: undecaprenyl/decaprenyl-phosphate alpha-N-acetylglucosaminyl 1-phosphate transferase [Actinomycetota bacterium]
MAWWQYLVLGGVALSVTLLLTPWARRLGERTGAVALAGGRNVHEGTVSRFGGVAMFLGFVATLAVAWAGDRLLGWDLGVVARPGQVLGVLAGATVIFAVGVLDDLHTWSPRDKLLGQIAAAVIAVAAGARVEYIGNPFGPGLQSLGLAAYPVTVLWLVGFANVINLIDGLDGLAGGVAAISAGWFALLAAQSNQVIAAVFAVALLGACVGFLRYNFHPASVFMGDSGSMFLGFILGSIALMGVMKSTAAITLAVPLLIIGVPIFDTGSAIIRRILHRRPIQEADKGHLHHRLLGRGYGQRMTVTIIWAWSFALAVAGYAMRYAPSSLRWVTLVLVAVPSAFVANRLGLFDAAHHHVDEG